jgi:predicted transposase YbfD/YdcC
LDGKSLACAAEAGARSTPIHLVTAWATEQRLVLAVRRAPGRSETRAALDLVETLDLLGAIVTADALHGTRAMSRAIRARGGNYALAIKGNRGPLHRAMKALLADPDPAQAAMTTETAHGRYEERQAWTVAAPADWAERFGFTDLATVVRVDALRRIGTAEERQSRFYALSRPMERSRAARHPRSLEHREQSALGSRRPHGRGSQPRSKGQCRRKPRPPAKARSQPSASRPRKSLPSRQNEKSRMAGRVPRYPHQPNAIALPSRGRRLRSPKTIRFKCFIRRCSMRRAAQSRV